MPMSGEPANTPNFTVCVNLCPTAAAPCGFCSEAATVCSQARTAVTNCPALSRAGAPEACLAGHTYLSRTAHCATACAALSALRRCAASPAAAPCDTRRRCKLLQAQVRAAPGARRRCTCSLASVETPTAASLRVQNLKDLKQSLARRPGRPTCAKQRKWGGWHLTAKHLC